MSEQKKIGAATVLLKFFGTKPGQKIVDFTKDELSKLTEDEKLELGRLAAKELGLTQSEVSFELS